MQKLIKKFSDDKLFRINLMNVILCFSVIIIHITSKYCNIIIKSSFSTTFLYFINKLLCFAVPGFLFLSGLKLYLKYNSSINLKEFYKNRFKKIYAPYIISVFVYMLYYLYKGYFYLTPRSVLKAYFIGDLVAHFYYIIIAIQAYLLFPILIKLVSKYPKLTLFASSVCTIIFKQFISFTYSDRFIGTYIVYFIFGMIFAKYKEKIKNNLTKKFILVLIPCCITAICFLLFSYNQAVYKVFFKYIELLNIAYSLFSIILIYYFCHIIENKLSTYKSKNNKVHSSFKKVINCINKNSYNIYLYHILFMQVFQWEILSRYTNLTPIQELLLTSAFLVFSLYIFCFIYNKILSLIQSKKQIQK